MGRLEDARRRKAALVKEPDDLNGNGYFYMRLCWTGVCLQANFDEEYELLCAMLLFFSVGLKRP